jgi:hypothetical protein
MTEAFRRNNSMVSVAIHLFIDAFPSGWMKAIMDCKRQPKPAFFAYLDALTPLMVNLRTDRQKFFAGQEVSMEAWACNDLCDVPDGAYLHYQLEDSKGKVVFADRVQAQIPSCASRFQGFIRFVPPSSEVRETYHVRVGLIHKQGKVLHDSSVKIEVFPNSQSKVNKTAVILGKNDGKAAILAKDLGFKRVFTIPQRYSGLILIDDFEKYAANRKKIDKCVAEGAVAVFVELPKGEFLIAEEKVKVELCGMNPRHFVSRATGHPLVEGFEPEDFKCWFDPKAGYITPILSSGNGGWAGQWYPALAVAQKKYGKGCFRISQIMLADRVSTNPTALLFAQRLDILDIIKASV